MRKGKSAIITTAAFGVLAGFGIMVYSPSSLAMDAQKSEKGAANTPENVQRSAPAGQKVPGSGTGPSSRTDQLTEMDEVEAKKNPTDPEKLLKEKGISAESKK